MNDDEWIERLIRCEFSAAVSARIGRWSAGEVHPVLGKCIYEFRDHRLVVCICAIGVSCAANEVVQAWMYDDIDEVFPASLRALARAGGPDGDVKIGIRARGDLVRIDVPLKVYSTLCPALLRIVDRSHGR